MGAGAPSVGAARALSSSSPPRPAVDLRSDTVTQPTREMLETALMAPTGDDVMGEDPTVTELEGYAAELFGKELGLFVPTGTMGNLCALLSHCHGRASEVILGASSHICLYEGGGAANLGGIHTRQVQEDPLGATLDPAQIRAAHRRDDDDHYARTALVCVENTHNMLGGVPLRAGYVDAIGSLCRDELGVPLHVDGARIFNAAVALGVPVGELCRGADSVSVCLSKGLGAPLGTVLVGDAELLRLARRARKRLGGGMRQGGVVAAMGLYALRNHVDRLAEDHARARRLADELGREGLALPRGGEVETDIVYFALPEESRVSVEELCRRLEGEHGVKIGGGYARPGEAGVNYIRAVTHMDVDDEGIDRAVQGIVKLVHGR